MKEPNPNIIRAIALAADMCGVQFQPETIAVMASELSGQPEQDVLDALRRCCRECQRGRFSLAAVFDRLPNQPPDDETAWGMALKARLWDESATLVVPEAVWFAWSDAEVIWNSGDKVGARMAFKAAWPEALRERSMECRVSLGNDREGQAPALRDAVTAGLITVETAEHWLPECNRSEFLIDAPRRSQLTGAVETDTAMAARTMPGPRRPTRIPDSVVEIFSGLSENDQRLMGIQPRREARRTAKTKLTPEAKLERQSVANQLIRDAFESGRNKK